MIDIIIPNYNGAALLPACLDALRRQTRQDFVATVVDDGSTDSSLEVLEAQYPEVQVIRLQSNHGLAAAINIAIARTSSPFVVLLNNDTEADPSWLAELVGTLERYPNYAFAASKLMLFDRRDVLHAAGDGYTPSGRPFNRGVWQPDRGQYDALTEVWGPCAGAAAYRRCALERLAIGGLVLDNDLFMYCEDVDLNLRARLAGFRTIFVPAAVVYHRLSATGGGTLASYYCGRNFIDVWAKNMPARLIRRHLTSFVIFQLGTALDALRHITGAAARARLRGQVAGMRDLPRFLRKRRERRQCVTDQEFAQWLGR
ncbi:MAG TPA: glycosyltransferase family 2 protein [Herpetosiphonaceae bacterium]|nr:glycosyltransferase family 2 protein [Herpetosiphonaceae bacterium]